MNYKNRTKHKLKKTDLLSSKGRSNRWQKSFAFTSFIIFLCFATTSCCIRFWHFFATSICVHMYIYNRHLLFFAQCAVIRNLRSKLYSRVYIHRYVCVRNYLVRPFARKAYDLRRRLRIAIKRNLANARTHTHGQALASLLTYIHKYTHTHAYESVRRCTIVHMVDSWDLATVQQRDRVFVSVRLFLIVYFYKSFTYMYIYWVYIYKDMYKSVFIFCQTYKLKLYAEMFSNKKYIIVCKNCTIIVSPYSSYITVL